MIHPHDYGRIHFGRQADINRIRRKFAKYNNNAERIAKMITAEDISGFMETLQRWDAEQKIILEDFLKCPIDEYNYKAANGN